MISHGWCSYPMTTFDPMRRTGPVTRSNARFTSHLLALPCTSTRAVKAAVLAHGIEISVSVPFMRVQGGRSVAARRKRRYREPARWRPTCSPRHDTPSRRRRQPARSWPGTGPPRSGHSRGRTRGRMLAKTTQREQVNAKRFHAWNMPLHHQRGARKGFRGLWSPAELLAAH